MLIRYGYRITLESDGPVPLITMMTARPERRMDLRGTEQFRTDPEVACATHLDVFGNLRMRLTAPGGRLTLQSDAVIADSGLRDPICPAAQEIPVASLPDEVLPYLAPSRYCESDMMGQIAWDLFGNVAPGWPRVQAICDFVHQRLVFSYGDADVFRTAHSSYAEQKGVCRDYAHLAIALCRALNIPARYAFGYLGDIGVPPSPDPMDFAAWMHVWLSGRWWAFDPRNNSPRIGRITIGHGRDAADVPMIASFGTHRLVDFKVWTDQVKDDPTDPQDG
ncbi:MULTISPECIES: transglutaminase-like domain-containing protein [unclassified Paracoccus (in: a-proteobacteria)]|uniref:transglutaminase-like domain-containing protein n=1 Tax=unclassified Paracoccus (in: a-proteobacteria) TaxID=2688777 RepID=UPI0012B1E27F|nr:MULTISPECIES: transglutaminase family protein [unclassified Paracoccus (in: a-proteobacteria)]UXU76237.1 transglutaminase family protein [Paracoccus sp. SMMA_5]UXU80737.1 transglutaminase family protein [Paracoccus sp. SMMA_5_TC]